MHPRDGLEPHSTVAQRYAHLVETGEITDDPAQRQVVAALDSLIDEIAAKRLQRKSSALGWLFAKNRAAAEPVTGLYIHGGVGRGKTMLMDLFFEAVPVRRKRRVHFNAFMADVHDRIQKHRQARKEGTVREDDPIPPVARALADEAWILCFDEFSVTDIADAMILSRLFSALFANGVVLVATSNVAPDDLYRDGLNRQLFLPFVALLKRHAEVMRARYADRLPHGEAEPHAGLPDAAGRRDRPADGRGLEDRDARPARRARRPSRSRAARCRCRVASGDAARFSFADLCEKPLGARDYLAIADRYRRRSSSTMCRCLAGRPAQRGEAFHPLDRHALRPAGPACSSAPKRRRRSSIAARQANRSVRVRPHGLAADRDAGPRMAGRLGGEAGGSQSHCRDDVIVSRHSKTPPP